MIIDSSALLAVLDREPGAEVFETVILTAAPCRMSAANVLETSIVVEGRVARRSVTRWAHSLGMPGLNPLRSLPSILRQHGGPGGGSARAGIQRH